MPHALTSGLTTRQLAAIAMTVVAAALVGAACAAAPMLTAAAGLAVTVIVFAALRPVAAVCLLIFVTPLLAGLDRGGIPLRPYEGLIVLVAVGIAARILVVGRPGDLRFDRVQAAIVALAVCASIVPLVVMLARGRQIGRDEVLYAMQMWKYYVVFLVVRVTLRTERQVRLGLTFAIVAACIAGLVGILQALQIGPVPGFVAAHFLGADESTSFAYDQRGTSTLASSIATADVTVFAGAAAAAWALIDPARRRWLVPAALLLVFGAVGAGQFSGFIGIVVAVFALGAVTRNLGRYALAFSPLAVVASVVMAPVIQKRLSGFQGGQLPQSWQGRLDNLNTFFLPTLLHHGNWLTGVSPAGRVDAPENWRKWVYIESGHVWLLWTGGVALFAAFVYFLWVTMPLLWRLARRRSHDVFGVAAAASFTALAVLVVLMSFDPHLSLRGSADLNFTLLALALGGLTAPAVAGAAGASARPIAGRPPPHRLRR